jgi:STE24 endopeptidase
MTATRIRSRHFLYLAALLLPLAAAWVVAVVLLWRTQIPGDLRLPHLDPSRFFTSEELEKAADYERFLRVDWALSVVASLVTLVFLTAKAPEWARAVGLGRVGSGVIVGMLTLTTLWFVSLPFEIAARWWRDRHGLTRGSYLEWLTDPWLTLVAEAVVALVVIVVVMALAGRFPRMWWLAVAPIWIALAVGVSFGYGALITLDTHAVRSPELRAQARTIARKVDAQGTPVEVQEVHNLTTQANAMAVGLGPTERIVLWDTLLDGRFTDREVGVVLAHEFGHIIRGHLWKGLVWFALFAVPGLYLIARITDRRGGMGDPGVLPFGLLVLTLLGVALMPLTNVVSRRYEAEADWVALRTTRDPQSAKGLFQEFSETSLAQPNPPTWAYVMFENHPTLMQRIAMAEAFADREGLASANKR